MTNKLSILGTAIILFLTTAAFIFRDNTESEKSNKQDSETVGIDFFEGDWQAAKMKAKKENKLIFLDAYASWCGPCKKMEKVSFTDTEVGEYFNANFINYKMDMEKHPDGQRLAKHFKLTLYPTLYFLNENEEIVHYALGFHKPKHLIQVAEDAKIQKK